ncbi:Receptor protein kinase-like protein ZAR1 [Vitis vinifera]|uniref:Receptor protein kinase-like protein ZAR1 n=1 Tax=Vitis vinifera TaxID=29760 RepID=A0A438DIM8_VITVI|nr:Receptor protein kinase-like protein ZAR1 [Vitis vinifera]
MQLFSLSFFLFFFLLNPTPSLSLSSDGLSLLSLKSAVDDAASAFSDWNEDDPNPCRWTGISCMNVSGFSDPRVVGIAISGRNLRGYIPSELGNLFYLRRLNLHGNNFYGSIPVQLFNASSLHSIFLYGNNLSEVGRHPESIFRRNSGGDLPEMENLVQLDLSSNEFNGSIPDDIGELKSLSGTLNLSHNHFTGKIPKSLGNLPETVSFDLRSNNLSGEIPQTGAFANQGPTAFLNNPDLCGFPLQKSCRNPSRSSPEGQSSSPESGTNARKGLSPGLIILISVADAAGVAFIGLIIVYIYWKNRDSQGCSCTGKEKLGSTGRSALCSCLSAHSFQNNDSEMESDKERGGKGAEGDLVAIDKGFSFELDELLRASAYVLGKSGLGIVYKVVLGNGVPVAVRRLGEGGEQRYKEFVAEVQAIGRVKHPNVVKLRAYYWAPDEKLLISDFISNGNLANALRARLIISLLLATQLISFYDFLFSTDLGVLYGSHVNACAILALSYQPLSHSGICIQGRSGQPSSSLSWSTRLKIAKGTARGLAYLHECSPRKQQPCLIRWLHWWSPPLSKISPTRTTQQLQSPEARVANSRPTQKWDVYSFGVVLLELLTGKSPELSSPTTSTSTEVPDLVKWVRKGFEEENPLSDMVDPLLLQEVQAKKEVLAVFHVALACTEGDPELRPRMKTLSENLERIGS